MPCRARGLSEAREHGRHTQNAVSADGTAARVRRGGGEGAKPPLSQSHRYSGIGQLRGEPSRCASRASVAQTRRLITPAPQAARPLAAERTCLAASTTSLTSFAASTACCVVGSSLLPASGADAFDASHTAGSSLLLLGLLAMTTNFLRSCGRVLAPDWMARLARAESVYHKMLGCSSKQPHPVEVWWYDLGVQVEAVGRVVGHVPHFKELPGRGHSRGG